MIDKDYLKRLAAYENDRGQLITISLSTSRLDDWRKTAPTFLNSEYGRIVKERSLTKEDRRRLDEDFQRIQEVVHYDVEHETQGLVVIADSSQDLFERVELPLRLKNRFIVEPHAYIRPLVHAVAVMEPFVLVRVSRDDSSIYVIDWWRLTRQDDFVGPYLRSSDKETGEFPVKEYYAAARQEALVEQHFKDVSQALERLIDETGIGRVAICGQHDIAAWFRRSLAARVDAKVCAEIPCDAAASLNQLLVAAREAVRDARIQQQVNLARKVQEGLGPQGLGVAGLDQTMQALALGQVQTLLVERGYRPPGCVCLKDALVRMPPEPTCPVCGGEVFALDDAFGEAVRLAVLQGATVEVVERVSALHEMGGIAALLRFK